MKSLTGRQKARLITLALIVAYLCYGICAYAWDVRMQTPQFEYVDNMQVDGSNMAPVANLFVAGTNGLISFITMLLSIVAMTVIGLILLVPWRCISLRKKSQVTEAEWRITKYLFYAFCAVSLIGGLVILRFTNLLYLLLLTAVTASLIALFALWPTHRVFYRGEMEKEEEEMRKYLSDDYIPVIKASICNGEQVAGFKEKRTGHFEELMLIRSEKDLQEFKEQYGIESITKEY